MPKNSGNPLPYVVMVITVSACLAGVAKKKREELQAPPSAPLGTSALDSPIYERYVDIAPPLPIRRDPLPTATGETVPVGASTGARVVLVSLDGMHVKLIDVMPVMRQLFAQGSHTLKARVPRAATTAPSHATLFTGADPEVNGVITEPVDDARHSRHVHGTQFRWTPNPLKVNETIFTAVEKTDRKVKAFVEKGKLIALLRPDGDETGIVVKNSIDKDVLPGCKAFIDPSVGLIILHFKMIDGAGHRVGWLTPEQEKEARIIDAKLGQICDCIAETDGRDGLATTLIVTADHGGTPGLKKGHSANDDDNRLVPWVAVGPGIKVGYEIQGRSDLPPIQRPRNGKESVPATMLLYDTVPTILRVLGMPRSALPALSENAKSVDEIFASD